MSKRSLEFPLGSRLKSSALLRSISMTPFENNSGLLSMCCEITEKLSSESLLLKQRVSGRTALQLAMLLNSVNLVLSGEIMHAPTQAIGSKNFSYISAPLGNVRSDPVAECNFGCSSVWRAQHVHGWCRTVICVGKVFQISVHVRRSTFSLKW